MCNLKKRKKEAKAIEKLTCDLYNSMKILFIFCIVEHMYI